MRNTRPSSPRAIGADAGVIVEVAREIGRAGSAFAATIWRNAAAGNLGGWQVARVLELLSVLVGAIATPGGTAPAVYNKFSKTIPELINRQNRIAAILVRKRRPRCRRESAAHRHQARAVRARARPAIRRGCPRPRCATSSSRRLTRRVRFRARFPD